MFEEFGEFNSFEEINEKAQELLKAADTDAVRRLAKENGLDPEEAEDYITGETNKLCYTALMAAVGKLDLEEKDLEIGGVLKDWTDCIRDMCVDVDGMAPNGEAVISVRIAGEGRKMLMIKGVDIDSVVVDVRSGEKTSCTWDQMIDEMEALCPGVEDGADGRKAWEILYGEAFPEKKEKVAPVQPQKKTDARRESKVTKAKKPEKTKSETPAAGQPEEGKSQEEDQKPEKQEAAGVENEESGEKKTQEESCAGGEQDREPSADTESGYDEDGACGGCGSESSGSGADREKGTGVAPVQPDVEADGKKDAVEAAGVEQYVDNQKQSIMGALLIMQSQCNANDWDGLIGKAKDIITIAEAVKNIEEVYRNE